MNNIECETCIKRKTIYCHNSGECYDTENKPFYQNRIMLLKENKELHNKIDKLSNENKSLRIRIKTIKRLRKHQTQKKNKYKSIITNLQNALTKKNNKIDKAIEYIEGFPLIHYSSTEKIEGKRLSGKLVPVDELLEILKGNE